MCFGTYIARILELSGIKSKTKSASTEKTVLLEQDAQRTWQTVNPDGSITTHNYSSSTARPNRWGPVGTSGTRDPSFDDFDGDGVGTGSGRYSGSGSGTGNYGSGSGTGNYGSGSGLGTGFGSGPGSSSWTGAGTGTGSGIGSGSRPGSGAR